jgi:hypothetical protein
MPALPQASGAAVGNLLEPAPRGKEFFIENEFKVTAWEVRSLAVKAHQQGVAEFPVYKRPS